MANVTWEFTSGEVAAVQTVVADYRDSAFVSNRVQQNVEGDSPQISQDLFWEAHVAALLTSRQRSGPDSPVSTFIQTKLDELGLEACRDAADIAAFVSSKLEDHGGVRFYNKIGEACEQNFQLLVEQGEWGRVNEQLETLRANRNTAPRPSDADQERTVCEYLYGEVGGEGLHGIGSKQSRNLLQMLGLTRYETPLDSRISRWMNDQFDLPYQISGSGLNEPEFYNFHMDLVQAVCERAGELPCVFDAAVFSSYDSEWTEATASTTF